MQWLALHFHQLPLEVFVRGAPSDRQPLAIVSDMSSGAAVVAVNRTAWTRGVRTGMRMATACALAPGLRAHERNIAREQATLARIAAWAMQFTSFASISEPQDVLLEIGGSLKLFGGMGKLSRHIAKGIAELGFDVNIACAPTPLAAQFFARAGMAVRIQHRDALRHALEKLPVVLLGDEAAQLERFGVQTFGECLQLPRDGLARRAGPAILDNLDRALGLQPDPRMPFTPPRTYSASLPLPAPVESADALLFAARRLLAELCGWLTAIGHGVQHLRFEFIHEKQIVTQIRLELVHASRDLDHLSTLLRERLARTELPCAALEITVISGHVTPLASLSLSFLPDRAEQMDSTSRFMERLSARLGGDTILGLMPWPDYRPERAWRACEPGHDTGMQPYAPVRPLWLLSKPRPLRAIDSQPYDDGPLSLLAGPECIETGWWDEQNAERDYFVARNALQSLLWVYRERNAAGRWFVHGIFA